MKLVITLIISEHKLIRELYDFLPLSLAFVEQAHDDSEEPFWPLSLRFDHRFRHQTHRCDFCLFQDFRLVEEYLTEQVLHGVHLAVPPYPSKSHQLTALLISCFASVASGTASDIKQLTAEQLVYELILLTLVGDRRLLDLLRPFAFLLLHENRVQVLQLRDDLVLRHLVLLEDRNRHGAVQKDKLHL